MQSPIDFPSAFVAPFFSSLAKSPSEPPFFLKSSSASAFEPPSLSLSAMLSRAVSFLTRPNSLVSPVKDVLARVLHSLKSLPLVLQAS